MNLIPSEEIKPMTTHSGISVTPTPQDDGDLEFIKNLMNAYPARLSDEEIETLRPLIFELKAMVEERRKQRQQWKVELGDGRSLNFSGHQKPAKASEERFIERRYMLSDEEMTVIRKAIDPASTANEKQKAINNYVWTDSDGSRWVPMEAHDRVVADFREHIEFLVKTMKNHKCCKEVEGINGERT